jgi:hypothetical protein
MGLAESERGEVRGLAEMGESVADLAFVGSVIMRSLVNGGGMLLDIRFEELLVFPCGNY